MKFSESQSSLVTSVEKECQKLAQKWEQFLRSKGTVVPELPGAELKLSKTKTWREVLFLTIIHHFLEDEVIRWNVKAELLERRNQFQQEYREILLVLTRSKAEMILFILETGLFRTPREFFGFLGGNIQLDRYTLYLSMPRKPKRVPRRRGYSDHGSRKPTHKWLPQSDFSLTEAQNRIEAERSSIKDSINLIEGGIQ